MVKQNKRIMINENLLEMQIRRYYASNNQGYMVLPISSLMDHRHQPTTISITTD